MYEIEITNRHIASGPKGLEDILEHIIATDMGNGFLRLKAEKGWRLFAINLNRCVSSATIKEENINNFKAIK